MAIDWNKIDKSMDIEGLKKDMQDAADNGGGNFKEVPEGEYEVKVEKLELTQSKKGDPMLSCWFGILNGEYKGSKIFMNQVANAGLGLHRVHEFLKSLDSGIDVPKFDGYKKLNDTILDVHEAIDKKLEYGLKYGKNSKGFNTFEITDVFEVE